MSEKEIGHSLQYTARPILFNISFIAFLAFVFWFCLGGWRPYLVEDGICHLKNARLYNITKIEVSSVNLRNLETTAFFVRKDANLSCSNIRSSRLTHQSRGYNPIRALCLYTRRGSS